MVSIEEMARFCKEKGFVYQHGEIYGGLAGFWDLGPLGIELKNNVKQSWWKRFVQEREDVVGIEGALVNHPKIWEASGHVSCFADLVLTCTKCKAKMRADHFIEDTLKITTDGMKADEINALIEKHKLCCPKCKGSFAEVNNFNLMFETQVGPSKDKTNTAYLRPETAQLMFTNFHLVAEHARMKLPFGIAQSGKAFRNEISPRDFLFRSREFEAMEIEFFVHPDKKNECPYFDEIKDIPMVLKDAQEKEHKTTFKELAKKTTTWHAYWVAKEYEWFTELGIDPTNLRIREHNKKELAHYATACFDIEYHFPFGWKEIYGNADRTQYDLTQHTKFSGKDLSVYDEETKTKIMPYVASEPAQGVERAYLAFLFDAYTQDAQNKERDWVVLKLHPQLAPTKIAIYSLVKKLDEKARDVYNLLKKDFVCLFDNSGAIGRRYARADERGIPICITIDFETIEKDNCVTLRDRDTTKQIRVNIKDLKSTLYHILHENNKKMFE